MWFRKPASGDRIVYAVGDVHGRLDLLEQMLERLAEDAARDPSDKPRTVIFMGDYVDRGPQSSGVVQRLKDLESSVAELRFLKGNHEATLQAFLEDASVGPQWCAYGGAETLASYGVFAPRSAADEAGWRRAREEFREKFPVEHAEFLGRLELIVEIGDYVFVHAGVRPGRTLQEQEEHDLLWIRNDFLNDRRPVEGNRVVVHGHTPENEPFRDRRRIGVDTGAYMTGVLTCARIEDSSVRFLFAKR